VISVEGLRSPKAIAFIGSQLDPKTQIKLRGSFNGKVTPILQPKNLAEDTLNVLLTKNIGEFDWTN
jgi:hypothetical protein